MTNWPLPFRLRQDCICSTQRKVTYWKMLIILVEVCFFLCMEKNKNKSRTNQDSLKHALNDSGSSLVICSLASHLASGLGFSIINYKTLSSSSSSFSSSLSASIHPPTVFQLLSMNDLMSFSFHAFASAHRQNIETLWHFSCPLSHCRCEMPIKDATSSVTHQPFKAERGKVLQRLSGLEGGSWWGGG